MNAKGDMLAKRLLDNLSKAGKGTGERIEAETRRNRQGWGLLRFADSSGKPLSNVEIKLEQISHEFRFGCNLFKLKDFDSEEKNKAYEGLFKKVFNQAVVPMLWDTLEPKKGELRFGAESRRIPRRPPTDIAVEWCEENGIEPKGHWLLCDNFVPDWLPKNSRQVMALLEERIAQLAGRYGKRVPVWDALNEPFGRPWRGPETPSAILPDDYVFQTFKLAERYMPTSARLLFNDGGDEFFGKRMFVQGNSPDYILLRNLLLRGAKLDGIGMQFHRYGNLVEWLGGAEAASGAPRRDAWGVDGRISELLNPIRILDVLDQYGKLGLPISISEISISTVNDLPRREAEALQGEIAERLYRLWFSHESCDSIVWWNLCDKSAYGSESQFDAGLIGSGFEEKPSYKALDRLINTEWRTQASVRTDESGMAEWRGFYGSYKARIHHCGKDSEETISLSKFSPNEFSMEL